jgi:serine/threonine protein kinase
MIGTTLGQYRIVAELGAGGMGVVYRAADERLGRDVALKVLPAGETADEASRARLMREARTASALNHPHVCTIYEVIEAEGRIAIAMELVEGRSLREAIGGTGLAPEWVARYGAQIADALAHAHAKGVIHRDLKSANVVIAPQDRAKVLDFGLAKRLSAAGGERLPDSLSLTQSGLIIGTPPYLAPEVLTGASSDERSDLWALGVLLYEMASGRLPFGGRTVVEIAAAILHDPVPSLPARVPPGLQAVILRCLAKDPGQRYRNADEVRSALENAEHAAAPTPVLRSRARLPIALAAAATLGVAAVFGLLRSGRFPFGGATTRSAAPVVAGPRFSSLAVLPLANLSGDPQQEYFADGMTEELISDLGPISALRVISRTSVLRYKGTQKPVPEVARELGVDAIVEGSVRRAGDRVRISARLIDGKSDGEVWSKTYEREVTDVLNLQREVAIDIAEMIRIEVTPNEHQRMTRPDRAVNPEANDLYLKGRSSWGTLTREGVQHGMDLYQQAIVIDPSDPRFYAGIADAYLVMAELLGVMTPAEAMPRAKEYAQKALALDDQIAEGHTSMAAALFLGDWDWVGAEREARRALDLSPGSSEAMFTLASVLGGQGRAGESIEIARRARDRDPGSLVTNWCFGEVLLFAGRYDEALAQARHTLALDPASPLPTSQIVLLEESRRDYVAAIGAIDAYLGQTEEGKGLVTALRAAYASTGPRGYSRVLLDRSPSPSPLGVGRTCFRARLCALLGEREQALDILEAALAAHDGALLFLNVEPGFESLRGEPRFKAMVTKIGLSPTGSPGNL